MLPEEASVATLDETYYLASIRRSLDNLLKFFFPKAQIDRLFGNAEAVLRRRGMGVRGLADSAGFIDASTVLEVAVTMTTAPKETRQTTLAERRKRATKAPRAKKNIVTGGQRRRRGSADAGAAGKDPGLAPPAPLQAAQLEPQDLDPAGAARGAEAVAALRVGHDLAVVRRAADPVVEVGLLGVGEVQERFHVLRGAGPCRGKGAHDAVQVGLRHSFRGAPGKKGIR